ncbi:extracellular solute-binding protein [Streptomyces seoulensis]|uniref:extracellular solute-binding protein n=1 Tax=Streptomyces seoulensis TaxID=73044 RepID=UPI003C2BE211
MRHRRGRHRRYDRRGRLLAGPAGAHGRPRGPGGRVRRRADRFPRRHRPRPRHHRRGLRRARPDGRGLRRLPHPPVRAPRRRPARGPAATAAPQAPRLPGGRRRRPRPRPRGPPRRAAGPTGRPCPPARPPSRPRLRGHTPARPVLRRLPGPRTAAREPRPERGRPRGPDGRRAARRTGGDGIVEDFERGHPGIDVEPQVTRALTQQLDAAVGAGARPDLAVLPSVGAITKYRAEGALRKLDVDTDAYV